MSAATASVVHDLARLVQRRAGQLRAELWRGALGRMAIAEAGLAAGRFEAIAVRGSHGDATAAEALSDGGPVERDRTALCEALRAALVALDAAQAVADRYPPPHPPTEDDKAAIELINGKQSACANCARTKRSDGQPRWEPTDSRLQEATTVGGRLDRPMLLCVWCNEKVRAWGRLPTAAELDRHHEGKRVPWPADVERPADAK